MTRAALLAIGALVSTAALAAGAANCETCTVQAHFAGYRLPVSLLASGDSIQWQAIDYAHVQVDVGSSEPCFAQVSTVSDPGPGVRFDATASGLHATTLGETRLCGNASLLDSGEYALQYHCTLHPVLMRAIVIVSPGG